MDSDELPRTIEELARIDLAQCEYQTALTIVEGVIAPGQNAWPLADRVVKVHCFRFGGWRICGGPLREQPLILLRPYLTTTEDDDQGQSVFSLFPDYSIQRFRVVLSMDEPRSVVESILNPPQSDDVLREFAERYSRPVITSTVLLGDLVLDRHLNCLDGQTKWLGAKIGVHCDRGDDGTIDNALETARQLWADQPGWTRRVAAFAASELLPTKNEYWLDDNEEPLTTEQFVSRMHLLDISLGRDGAFEFWHDDGDMFLGHAIQVRGTLADGLLWANIAG